MGWLRGVRGSKAWVWPGLREAGHREGLLPTVQVSVRNEVVSSNVQTVIAQDRGQRTVLRHTQTSPGDRAGHKV